MSQPKSNILKQQRVMDSPSNTDVDAELYHSNQNNPNFLSTTYQFRSNNSPNPNNSSNYNNTNVTFRQQMHRPSVRSISETPNVIGESIFMILSLSALYFYFSKFSNQKTSKYKISSSLSLSHHNKQEPNQPKLTMIFAHTF
jgi:hypothetical protein